MDGAGKPTIRVASQMEVVAFVNGYHPVIVTE
jgi:hypothetical protein